MKRSSRSAEGSLRAPRMGVARTTTVHGLHAGRALWCAVASACSAVAVLCANACYDESAEKGPTKQDDGYNDAPTHTEGLSRFHPSTELTTEATHACQLNRRAVLLGGNPLSHSTCLTIAELLHIYCQGVDVIDKDPKGKTHIPPKALLPGDHEDAKTIRGSEGEAFVTSVIRDNINSLNEVSSLLSKEDSDFGKLSWFWNQDAANHKWMKERYEEGSPIDFYVVKPGKAWVEGEPRLLNLAHELLAYSPQGSRFIVATQVFSLGGALMIASHRLKLPSVQEEVGVQRELLQSLRLVSSSQHNLSQHRDRSSSLISGVLFDLSEPNQPTQSIKKILLGCGFFVPGLPVSVAVLQSSSSCG